MGFFQDPFGTIGRTVSQTVDYVTNTTENTTKKAAEFFTKPVTAIATTQAKAAGEILKSAKESGITSQDAVSLGRLAAGDPTAALGLLGSGLEAQGGAPSDMISPKSQPVVISQAAPSQGISPILIMGGVILVGGAIFLMRRK